MDDIVCGNGWKWGFVLHRHVICCVRWNCVPHCERMIRLYLLDDMHMQQLQRISLHIYIYLLPLATDNRKFSLSYMTICENEGDIGEHAHGNPN